MPSVRVIETIAAMATTLFSNLTCDIQNVLLTLAALQYTFSSSLLSCDNYTVYSLYYPAISCEDSMGLVARSIIKIIITGNSSKCPC